MTIQIGTQNKKMEKLNEFKLSALRQFGSENMSFTATVYSDKKTLTDAELTAQINQVGEAITKAFISVQERGMKEQSILTESSERRRESVKKLDDALKAETETAKEANRTKTLAERLNGKNK